MAEEKHEITPKDYLSLSPLLWHPTDEDDQKMKNIISVSPEQTLTRWIIRKCLTESDVIPHLARLMLGTEDAESHIMRYLPTHVQKTIQDGFGLPVKVYDHETGTEHDLIFKRYTDSSRSYYFNSGWITDFVEGRLLEKDEIVGLYWGVDDSRLHFRVIQRNLFK